MKRLRILIFCILAVKPSISEGVKPEIKKYIGPRIINGNPATLGQFPWQAALFFQESPTSDLWFCSGTIISEGWILTAGHCAQSAQTVLVYTGINDISLDLNPTETVQDFIIHEEFDPDSLANDVALIKLQQRLTFDYRVHSIPLSSQEIEVGTNITVSGWGKTRANDSSISPLLNYVNLVTISNEQCQQLYGSTGVILPEMICAGVNPSLMQTPCHGDSGGPVIVYLDEDPLHVAVASFVSDRGCESGYPSGYTRTAYYSDWIKEKTGTKAVN